MSIKILNTEQFFNRFEACEENVGQVRLVSGLAHNAASNPHGLTSNVGLLRQDMVICIKHSRKYKWFQLHKLSKANKIKFMDKIDEAFRNQCISQNLDVDLGAGTYIQMQQECERLELELRELKDLNRRTQAFMIKRLKKKTCVVEGCPGMCAEDFDRYNPEGFEVCFCCKKTQELECPICYETQKVSDMVCGSNCSHRICWKCYGMADRGGNKIEKCPMCRANF